MIKQTKRVQKESGKPAPTYELLVFLDGTEPLIWRRLLVPGNANLGWLHAVFQVAMGWTNSHLHQFICGEHQYADPKAELKQYEGDPRVLDEHKVTLIEALGATPQGFFYEYDFGDSWEHVVTVEKILPAEASAASTKAVCLGGAGACPPEDCGGLGGYAHLLKVLKNKKHPEHKSMKEWIGRPFDPEFFDAATTNDWLQKVKWPRVSDIQLGRVLMARDGYQA
jgi:hypothetical protein